MEKKNRPLAVLLAVGLLLCLVSLCSADYVYRIPITLTNTSATAYSNFVVFATVDNDTLMDNGFITNAYAFDTQVQEGDTPRAYLPRGSTLGFYVPTLGANETREFDYYLGFDPPQTAFNFMAGGSGYISTADSDTLEPVASDFEVEWKGYFDGTKTGEILAKGAEYGIISSTLGSVRGFVGAGAGTNSNTLPNALGYISQWTITGASTAWEALDDPVGVPDDATSYISFQGSGYRTAVNLQNIGGPVGGTITSVVVYLRARTLVNPETSLTPFLRLNSTNLDGSALALTTSWADYNQTITRPGGGAWSLPDIDKLEVGVSGTLAEMTQVTQLYVKVNYTPPATGLSASADTGVRTFKITKTGTTLELFVDTVSKGTTTVGAPSNTGSVVISSHNGPTTYTEYSKITIGTQKLWYQPNTVQGDTITDRSPVGTNTGTIVWGNSSPSGDIQITTGNLLPSVPTSYLGEASDEPEVVPVMTPAPNMSTTDEPVNIPGYDVIKALSGMGGAAQLNIWWFIIPVFVFLTLVVGLLTARLTRQLWVVVLVMTGCLAIGTSMAIINMWAPIIFGIIGLTVVAVRSWVFQ